MSLACSRSLFFMAFIASTLALGASWYLEYAIGLKPCGLCLVQRFFLMLLTGICLMAAIHGSQRRGSFVYWLLALLACLGGTVTAWWQILLQSDPQRFARCLSDQGEPFGSAPWMCVLLRLFRGNSDCSEISWTLFDLSIPEWSLLFFVALLILSIYQLLRLVWAAWQ
jgi:disulfide bond formation protein DsbB